MGKDKLRKFRENLTFACFVQPEFDEVFRQDHPLKGHWHEAFFHNDRPIVLELGCGKGEYTVALAERDPSRNYLGIDIKGARMWRGAKTATERGMANVGFLRTRIEFINSLFAEGEVAEIWITFPDPQLKTAHRRTGSGSFGLHGRRLRADRPVVRRGCRSAGMAHRRRSHPAQRRHPREIRSGTLSALQRPFCRRYADAARRDDYARLAALRRIFLHSVSTDPHPRSRRTRSETALPPPGTFRTTRQLPPDPHPDPTRTGR